MTLPQISRSPSRRALAGCALLLGRLVLGLLLLYSGLGKIATPQDFADALDGYRILPAATLTLAALVVPWLEATVGGFLVVGFLWESSVLLAALLSLTFGAAVASAMVRGLDVACGCFTGLSSHVSWQHVLLDGVMLALALTLLRFGPGPLALDVRTPTQPSDCP